MVERAVPIAGHARHDPLRVAEAVDRGGRLAPFLRFCGQCGQLYAELVAITSALSLATLPPRPRDYTLLPSDARRLRAGGWCTLWPALGSARDLLGSARDHVTRPLAIGFTTLGLAGLLLSAAPSLAPGLGSAAAPLQEDLRVGPASGSALVIDPSPAPGASSTAPTAPDRSLTPIVSAGLLAIGGGLFAARRIASRSRRVR